MDHPTSEAEPEPVPEAALQPVPDPTPAAPVPLPLELELQRALGDAIEGPYDRITLQEMLYTGRLNGTERVRVPGEVAFHTLSERPELAFVRERFHSEAVRARGSLSAAPQNSAAAPPPRAEDAVSEAMHKAGIEPGRLAMLVVGTVLVVVAVIVLVFVTQL